MARIILFDIDMTLINTNRAGRAALDAAFLRAFGVEQATAPVAIDGRTDRAIFSDIIAHHQLADGDIEAARRTAVDAYLAELEPTIAARGGSVLPGVVDLLDELDRSHGAVGLATGNMRDGARTKLGHFGLWERFAAGGFGGETPVRAEVVRAGIEAMAAVLGCAADAGDCIVVGDTPLDVEAALAAGARTLGVATGRFSAEALRTAGADLVVESLEGTEEILPFLRSRLTGTL